MITTTMQKQRSHTCFAARMQAPRPAKTSLLTQHSAMLPLRTLPHLLWSGPLTSRRLRSVHPQQSVICVQAANSGARAPRAATCVAAKHIELRLVRHEQQIEVISTKIRSMGQLSQHVRF